MFDILNKHFKDKFHYFTRVLFNLIDFVNFVNYKIGMDNKNKKNYLKSQENTSENMPSNSSSGIYLRDDHCDWGSSGMNEFTQEFVENN